MTCNSVDADATPCVLISGESWSAPAYDLASLDHANSALPWINLNRLELTAGSSEELDGDELVLYGTKGSADTSSPLIPTTFLGQTDGVGTWSFPELERGHYLLDLGTQQIEFSVLPGNASSVGVSETRVDFGDFAQLATNFGREFETLSPIDFNGDSVISFGDFAVLAGFFGSDTPSTDLVPTLDDALRFDLGDAPDSDTGSPTYHTLLANDGARHRIVEGGPILGKTIDAEPDGQPTTGAWGDDGTDVEADDEDGLLELRTLGDRGEAVIEVTADLESLPLLDGWLDFNGDGDWDDEGEQIFKNRPVENGTNVLLFDVPGSAWSLRSGVPFQEETLETYLRLRLSTDGDLQPSGIAADGEVEDYSIRAVPFIDTPDDEGETEDDPEGENPPEEEEDPGPVITGGSNDSGLPDDYVGTVIPDNAFENEPMTRTIPEILKEIREADEAGLTAARETLLQELRDARASQLFQLNANQLLKANGQERDELAEKLAETIAEFRGLGDRFPYVQLLKKMLLDTPHGEPCEFASLTIRVFPDDSMQLIFQDQDGNFRVERAYWGEVSNFDGEETGSGLIVESPTNNPNELRHDGQRSREYLPDCRRLVWGPWRQAENGIERTLDLQTPDADGNWVTEASTVGQSIVSSPHDTIWTFWLNNPFSTGDAVKEGAILSGKALANGIVDGVVSVFTVSYVSDGPDVFELSEADKFHTDTSVKIVSTMTGVVVGLAGGTGSALARGILILDTANNGASVGRGIADIAENGATVENVFGTSLAGLGLKGNLGTN